jgi:hypothetical protein
VPALRSNIDVAVGLSYARHNRVPGLDHGVGHPVLSVLCYNSSWWTEGRWWYRDRGQDRGKHRARLLPEKALRRCSPIRPLEAKVVDRGQAGPLSGVVESSQLMVPQREIPVAT